MCFRRALSVSVCAVALALVGCSDSDSRDDPDGALPRDDGSMRPDGSVPPPPPDGSMPDGSMPDGSMPDGSMPDGSMRDADIPPIGIDHSFDVVVAIEPDPDNPPNGFDFPTEQQFTLHLETVPDGLHAIAGRAGSIAEMMLASRGDGTFVYEAAMFSGASIGLDRPAGTCGGAFSVRYEHIELRIETTGAAGGLRVVGTAIGGIPSTGGDVIWDDPFIATFEGTLDSTAPSYTTSAREEHHVLDGLVVNVSEPVPTSTVVTLDGLGALVPDAADGSTAVARFAAAFGTVLPWGAPLAVSFAPSLTDLAGISAAGDPGSSARTIEDPGMITPDGFESAFRAWQANDVRIVSGASGEPRPIAGSGALYVGPGDFMGGDGGRVTMRVPVPAGATRLRARYRTLGSFGVTGYYNYFRVYAPNASAREDVRLDFPDGEGEPSGFEQLPTQSEVLDLDVALPAGTAGEVVVDIDNRLGCGGLPPPPAGLVIDDLRAE